MPILGKEFGRLELTSPLVSTRGTPGTEGFCCSAACPQPNRHFAADIEEDEVFQKKRGILTIKINHSAWTFIYPLDKGRELSIKHILTDITNL